MKRVNNKYFICEDGHVTVGNDDRSKCSAEGWNVSYIHGKRKNSWKEELTPGKACGKKVVETGDIPEELDLFSIWDYKMMHAFLIDQRIDADYMLFMQLSFKNLNDRVKALEEKK